MKPGFYWARYKDSEDARLEIVEVITDDKVWAVGYEDAYELSEWTFESDELKYE